MGSPVVISLEVGPRHFTILNIKESLSTPTLNKFYPIFVRVLKFQTDNLEEVFLFKSLMIVSVWCSLSGIGFWSLISFAGQSGRAADFKVEWPKTSTLQHQDKLPVIVLFLHPLCGCSQSTMSEFERLMPTLFGKAQIHVVFLKPEGISEKSIKGSLWNRAKLLKGVEVHFDEFGTESQIFGAFTSGQLFLYNPDQKLVFEGGLTPSRGHEGDARAQDFLKSYFQQKTNTQVFHTAVYGCDLFRKSL